jgi:cysteine synthase A
MSHWLLKHEGFFVGGSSGLNVCGAVMAARKFGRPCTIVTVLCDDAGKYLDKQWTPESLKR